MRTISPSIMPSMNASLVPMRNAAKAAAEAKAKEAEAKVAEAQVAAMAAAASDAAANTAAPAADTSELEAKLEAAEANVEKFRKAARHWKDKYDATKATTPAAPS